MDKIVYKLVYNRKRTLNRRGMALVQVEAYQGGQKRYFSTHVYLQPEQWDTRRRRVRNHPNADGLNRRLYGLMADLERRELQLWQQGKAVSPDLLKETGKDVADRLSFTDFMKQEVEQAAVKESTRRNLLSTLNLLHTFRSQIQFADLTYEFMADFEFFLRQKGYHTNTIAKHLKHLKQQANAAIRKHGPMMYERSYLDFKIKTSDCKHTRLMPDELAKLEQLQLSERHRGLQKTLDAFLFCCYAGLRYSDFTSLQPENIVNIEAERWLMYRSVKTQVEVRLPLYLLFNGKGLALLDKYAGCLEDFFQLKNNSNVNKQLRRLGQMAGLEKHISFHTARHTNATLLIYKGVNITTVQKLLGHKNVRTTQIYAMVMDRTLVHDLELHRD